MINLKEFNQGTERFDLQWIGTPFRSGVKMIADPINGKWHVSRIYLHGYGEFNKKGE